VCFWKNCDRCTVSRSPKRPVPCLYGCGKQFPASDAAGHVTSGSCLAVMFSCPLCDCDTKFTQFELGDHRLKCSGNMGKLKSLGSFLVSEPQLPTKTSFRGGLPAAGESKLDVSAAAVLALEAKTSSASDARSFDLDAPVTTGMASNVSVEVESKPLLPPALDGDIQVSRRLKLPPLPPTATDTSVAVGKLI
jgi:hypothetical protein